MVTEELVGYQPPTVPGTSLALLRTMGKALDERAVRIRRYDEYYTGTQRLAFATSKFRQTFGSLFSAFADNFCDLVVDAVEERLDVEGFRMGANPQPGKRSTQAAADKAAWAMWQANDLDAYSQVAHTEALIKETSYALVWAGPDPTVPEITIEDPYQVIVGYDVGSYRRRKAGLKRWIDEDGFVCATLYLPDRIEKYRSSTKRATATDWTDLGSVTWERRTAPAEDWPLRNPLGIVPIVPIVNRPRLGGVGRSEIIGVIPIQDAINKLVTDMIVASEYSAFRQRWATGIEMPTDEATGEAVDTLQSAIDRMWASGNEGAKFGEFEAADLRPFVTGIEMLIQHVASTTRTPYHYFLQHGGQPPSGESLRASETGLVAKARRKQRHFGEAWEEVIRLGFLIVGDKARGSIEESETIWRDPESRTEAEHVDALVKLASIGIPEEQLWADAGYTPTQIARFLEMRAREPQVPLLKPVEKTAPATATAPGRKTTVTRPDGGQVTISSEPG